MASGPYPDLVPPQLPNSVANQAPMILLEGLKNGLQASAQFAQMRQNSELEIQKMAMTQKLTEDQHQFEREKLQQQYAFLGPMQEAHAKMFESLGELDHQRAQAFADGTATAAQRTMKFNQQQQDAINDVNDSAAKLQLDDPNFATKDPVQFAKNVRDFGEMWGHSPLPVVQHAITKYQTIADQQKIPVRWGATFDPHLGPVGSDGKAAGAWIGGRAAMLPVWQVAEKAQDPLVSEYTMNAVMAGGNGSHIVKGFQDISGVKVPTTTTEFENPSLKSYMDKAQGIDWTQHVPSRVPAAMLPRSAAAGTTPTTGVPSSSGTTSYPGGSVQNSDVEQAADAMQSYDVNTFDPTAMPQSSAQPASSAPPDFQPTQTDMYLTHARNAIAQGASMQDVANRLQQDYGIDPSQLWQQSQTA